MIIILLVMALCISLWYDQNGRCQYTYCWIAPSLTRWKSREDDPSAYLQTNPFWNLTKQNDSRTFYISRYCIVSSVCDSKAVIKVFHSLLKSSSSTQDGWWQLPVWGIMGNTWSSWEHYACYTQSSLLAIMWYIMQGALCQLHHARNHAIMRDVIVQQPSSDLLKLVLAAIYSRFDRFHLTPPEEINHTK